ncbi:MAG: hypothetical protein Q7T77_01515 [Sulfuricurvum sp.]|nr:hypothetical protein [Sulfuricurvum sp.]
MSNTTLRYKAVTNSAVDSHAITDNDEYQFGCEFEFYIDIEKYDFTDAVERIRNKIQTFSNADILVDLVGLPTDEDKNHCVQIKPDQSLDSHGIEISIPITSQNGVKHYINHILPLIEEFGYTNQDTGLHFHISTIQKDGRNIAFYVYMLMCHDKQLLGSWQPRVGYSHNVMDILFSKSKSEARVIKTKKGTIWNLEKIEANHVEIKSIGGIDYHRQMDKILDEFDRYAECFDGVFKDADPKYRERLVAEHKQLIASLDGRTQAEFAIAVTEAGLIDRNR